MIATAPGKMIVAGEYAVLDGAPALVVAIDRRAIASEGSATGSSPFLLAVADELAARFGSDAPAVQRALAIACDTSQLFDGEHKLGLGSSAAVTVAASALALGSDDAEEVRALAAAAHARAQGTRGATGSGADIAASAYGGAIAFAKHAPASTGSAGPRSDAERRGASIERLVWPESVQLVAFYTGAPASTPELIARVAEARRADPVPVEAALAAISRAARAAIEACRAHDLAATGLLGALALAAIGMDQLAAATHLPLVPDCVRAVRAALGRFGGTAKTSGAGGGDVALAIAPAHIARAELERAIAAAGAHPLELAIDPRGVALEG